MDKYKSLESHTDDLEVLLEFQREGEATEAEVEENKSGRGLAAEERAAGTRLEGAWEHFPADLALLSPTRPRSFRNVHNSGPCGYLPSPRNLHSESNSSDAPRH